VIYISTFIKVIYYTKKLKIGRKFVKMKKTTNLKSIDIYQTYFRLLNRGANKYTNKARIVRYEVWEPSPPRGTELQHREEIWAYAQNRKLEVKVSIWDAYHSNLRFGYWTIPIDMWGFKSLHDTLKHYILHYGGSLGLLGEEVEFPSD